MNGFIRSRLAALAAIFLAPGLFLLQAHAQDSGAPAARAGNANRPPPAVGWVFKPNDISYKAPNKPVWHIADILAAHKGQTDWAQPVIKDQWFLAQYISMGPGQKTRTEEESDTLIWFIVQSGQIRFTIKGVDPFVASKDFMVQVPMRTPFSMETVGDTPSVRFEVRTADNAPIFPVADNPTPPKAPPGYTTVKVDIGGAGGAMGPSYSDTMKPYLDFDKDVVNNPNPPPARGGGGNFFVRDAHGFAVPIRGAGVPLPPDSNIGHFHLGLAEFWYVLEGDLDVKIEGVPDIVHGHYGDVVYSPHGAYHRTTLVGKPFSTRVAEGSVTDSGVALTPADQAQ